MHIENVLNSKYLLFVIGFIGIAGSLSERPMISSGALVFCVASAYGALAAKFDSLVSSVVFLLMPFVTGIGTLLFGSVVTPIPRALVVTASFIGLIFVSQLFGGPNNRLSVEQLFIPMGIFLISCLTNLFSTSKLVTFVAFGYDNFYHLAIFRNMANSRILLVGGEGLMSVVNSGPLGSGAALSMVCNVIGVNPLDVRQSVQFFAVISLIIPLMIFFVVHKLVKLLITESIPWLTSSLVGVVLFVGYPSHQWFSGFLHSNAGVLVVVVGLVTYLGVESKKLKSALLSIEVALLAFVYLIYAPLVIFLLVKVIFFDAQSEPKESRKTLVGHMSLALLATAFPSFLLSRSYGADHLFVGGVSSNYPRFQWRCYWAMEWDWPMNRRNMESIREYGYFPKL